MSAIMARQAGQVQLEQSDMCLALYIAKIAKEEFLCAAIEKRQFLIQTPRTEVREAKKQVVEFPAHKKVKVATERPPSILCQHYMAR